MEASTGLNTGKSLLKLGMKFAGRPAVGDDLEGEKPVSC
jgi:hypothetical protein